MPMRPNCFVEAGQEVNKGEVIARIGSTQRSTAPHLHFEVRINNELVDPFKIYNC